MTNYLLACLFLILSHVVPSAPGVRAWLLGRLGRPLFMGLYSVLSMGAIVWFVASYGRVAGETIQLFAPTPAIVQFGIASMPVALFLMIGRITTPFGEAARPLEAQGIYRICRFPGSVGILVWASLHLASTGDLARLIAFGTFSMIALIAMVKNQWVLNRSLNTEAELFKSQTHVVPFWSILKGNQAFVWGEIGWKRVLATLVTYGLLLGFHSILLGVGPLAWLG
jgi:uncharacterized membrane protein